MALFSDGIHSAEELWQRSDEQLSQLLEPLVARLLSFKTPEIAFIEPERLRNDTTLGATKPLSDSAVLGDSPLFRFGFLRRTP
jgi:hypothetical protein